MTREYIMNRTAREIAAENDASNIEREIGTYTGLSIDELADIMGNNDSPIDESYSDLTETLENAFQSWYDRENEERPAYTPDELALDLMLYAAWQQ